MGGIRRSYIIPLLASLPAFSSGVSLDCGRLRDDGRSWDLTALDGPHSVTHSTSHGPTVHNTTYTLDICKPLKGSECHTGTYVCGALTIIPEDGSSFLDGYIPIAGNFINLSGRTLDPTIQHLKAGDIQREGLRVELHGGQHPFGDDNGEAQQAVVDFICDPERTGLEGEDDDTVVKKKKEQTTPEGQSEGDAVTSQEDTGSSQDASEDIKSLRFKSYGHEEGTDSDVLRLEWLTKYVCEEYQREDSGGGHWGFFTWLIVLLFLCVAAYLIFGSWMNYNRYGARGWDMLPHSDTIRDIPYLLKDWAKRVVTTIQGPGSRGGYSAV